MGIVAHVPQAVLDAEAEAELDTIRTIAGSLAERLGANAADGGGLAEVAEPQPVTSVV